jgi:hypothetical protein
MATSCVRHVHTLNLWIDHEGHGWGIAWGLPVMCCASVATCGRYDEALNTNQKCRKTSRTERSFAKRAPRPDVEYLFLDVNAFCAHVIKRVLSRRLRLRYAILYAAYAVT